MADELIAKIHTSALLREAARVFAVYETRDWTIEQGPRVTEGYVLYVLHSAKVAKRLLARFPLLQGEPFFQESIQPLHYIAKYHPSIPAPQVYSAADAVSAHTNDIEAAYMLLDWMEGSPLQPFDLKSPPIAARIRVLEQLAEIMLESLLGHAQKDDINFYGLPAGKPRGVGIPATEWLTESVDRAIRRHIRRNEYDEAFDYLIQRGEICMQCSLGFDKQPWVVMHGDLHAGNIIVDEDSNITGIIDWDFTFAARLVKQATYPKLLDKIPGATPPDMPEELAQLDLFSDKMYFLMVFREKEKARTKNCDITQLIEFSSGRNFFEQSIHRIKAQAEWSGKYCLRTAANLKSALGRL